MKGHLQFFPIAATGQVAVGEQVVGESSGLAPAPCSLLFALPTTCPPACPSIPACPSTCPPGACAPWHLPLPTCPCSHLLPVPAPPCICPLPGPAAQPFPLLPPLLLTLPAPAPAPLLLQHRAHGCSGLAAAVAVLAGLTPALELKLGLELLPSLPLRHGWVRAGVILCSVPWAWRVSGTGQVVKGRGRQMARGHQGRSWRCSSCPLLSPCLYLNLLKRIFATR